MELNCQNCGVGGALLQPMVVEAEPHGESPRFRVAELGPDGRRGEITWDNCVIHDLPCFDRRYGRGQGLDLLEIRGWDDAALGVIKV